MHKTFTLRKFDYLALLLLVGSIIFFVVYNNACASHDSTSSCDNGMNVKGGDGGNTSSSNPPPPPLPCTVTLDKPLVASGTPSVVLSWTPTPIGSVTLSRRSGSGGPGSHQFLRGRSTSLTVPNNVTTFTDTISSLPSGTYSYSLSYRAARNGRIIGGGAAYACATTLTIVDKITECNDGVDNGDAEDSSSDTLDPGCHTDGNPTNSSSYVSTDDSESNARANLTSALSITGTLTTTGRISARATSTNNSSTYTGMNRFILGWRKIGGASCGGGGSSGIIGVLNRVTGRCFTHGGQSYERISLIDATYTAGQSRTLTGGRLPFNSPGSYQVCAVSDYDNSISETNESDNAVCRTVTVTDGGTSVSPPPVVTTITGPLTLTATPNRLRSGSTATLTWDTGGRIGCTITGGTQVIDLTGAASSDSETTIPILAETTYVMTCTDDNSRVETTVQLAPQYQEV